MPYSVRYLPISSRPDEPWAKLNIRTGRIASRHRSRKAALASVRAYYASRTPSALTLNARNPLRADPTRTTMIQRAWEAEIRRRFRALNDAVWDFLITQDALGLVLPRHGILATHQAVQFREYAFLTDPDKVLAFQRWFAEQVEADVFSPSPGTPMGQPWTTKYITSAYRRGQLNAYLSTRRALSPKETGFLPADQAAFLRTAFGQPETMNKIRLLATRSWEDMRGISGKLGADLNRFLAQGIADGRNPRAIADDMWRSGIGLSRNRATLIARSEAVHAHAEAQLDAFEQLGVKELGIEAELSSAGDDRVCDVCASLEGKIYSIEEARGLIPLHPGCRCNWTAQKTGKG